MINFDEKLKLILEVKVNPQKFADRWIGGGEKPKSHLPQYVKKPSLPIPSLLPPETLVTAA